MDVEEVLHRAPVLTMNTIKHFLNVDKYLGSSSGSNETRYEVFSGSSLVVGGLTSSGSIACESSGALS